MFEVPGGMEGMVWPKSEDVSWSEGRRIVDLDQLARQLECRQCQALLDLRRTERETRHGLASVLHVLCSCGEMNDVQTAKNQAGGNSDRPMFEVNVKLKASINLLMFGSGASRVISFLAMLDIPVPPPDDPSLADPAQPDSLPPPPPLHPAPSLLSPQPQPPVPVTLLPSPLSLPLHPAPSLPRTQPPVPLTLLPSSISLPSPPALSFPSTQSKPPVPLTLLPSSVSLPPPPALHLPSTQSKPPKPVPLAFLPSPVQQQYILILPHSSASTPRMPAASREKSKGGRRRGPKGRDSDEKRPSAPDSGEKRPSDTDSGEKRPSDTDSGEKRPSDTDSDAAIVINVDENGDADDGSDEDDRVKCVDDDDSGSDDDDGDDNAVVLDTSDEEYVPPTLFKTSAQPAIRPRSARATRGRRGGIRGEGGAGIRGRPRGGPRGGAGKGGGVPGKRRVAGEAGELSYANGSNVRVVLDRLDLCPDGKNNTAQREVSEERGVDSAGGDENTGDRTKDVLGKDYNSNTGSENPENGAKDSEGVAKDCEGGAEEHVGGTENDVGRTEDDVGGAEDDVGGAKDTEHADRPSAAPPDRGGSKSKRTKKRGRPKGSVSRAKRRKKTGVKATPVIATGTEEEGQTVERCETCQQDFPTHKDFRIHMMRVHKKRVYKPMPPSGLIMARKKASDKEKKRSAQRSREWRAKRKADPVQCELAKQRDQDKIRHMPATDEKSLRRRERAKIRQQRCRERKQAAKLAAGNSCVGSESRRERWAEYKRKERERWPAHKWQSHREKQLEAYHGRHGRQEEQLDLKGLVLYVCSQCHQPYVREPRIIKHCEHMHWSPTLRTCDMYYRVSLEEFIEVEGIKRASAKKSQFRCLHCGLKGLQGVGVGAHICIGLEGRPSCIATTPQGQFLTKHDRPSLLREDRGGALCFLCGSQFCQAPALERHLAAVHGQPVGESGRHACPHCPATFFAPSLLARHQATRHNPPGTAPPRPAPTSARPAASRTRPRPPCTGITPCTTSRAHDLCASSAPSGSASATCGSPTRADTWARPPFSARRAARTSPATTTSRRTCASTPASGPTPASSAQPPSPRRPVWTCT